MVGSIYLLFAGHNQPGGGFVGRDRRRRRGRVALRRGGIDDVAPLSRAHRGRCWAPACCLAASPSSALPLLGGAPARRALLEADLPLLGHVKATSALVFDIGVYLVVVGLVLMVFESFGDDPPAVEATPSTSRTGARCRERVVHDRAAATAPCCSASAPTCCCSAS